MGLRWLRCGVVLTGLVALGAGIGPMGAQAQGGDDLAALSAQVNELHGQGKYTEAMPIAERYVALARQKHGEEHTEFARAILWLAGALQSPGPLPRGRAAL